jgi:hypothetical protein
MDNKNKKLRKFVVNIITNPPLYMIELGLAQVEYKQVEITGYSLSDAKERAGVE